MGPIQSLEDLIGLIVRRRWLIILVAVIGTAIAAWYAKSRPDVFESAAVIQVQLPVVTDGAGQGSTAEGALQTLQFIEQRLTTRDNLIALIDRHNLFADIPALSGEDRVVAMRSAIRFESVSTATGSGLSAIIISARTSTSESSAQVANDLAQSVLDMGAEGTQAAADASTLFFQEEEARIWKAITALEAEIAAYRESNRAVLPGAREARQDELAQISTNIRALDQERAALQTEQAAILAQPNQRAIDRRRLDDITQAMAVLSAQSAPLLARKATLDASIGDVAELDRALSAYDRQLGQLQGQYSVVSTRLAEAETTQRLSSRQQTERFSLLDPAVPPTYPTRSSGKKIAIAGAIVSSGLALVLAFVFDLLRPVVRTSGQMERDLNLRPIVAIPDVPKKSRSHERRKKISSLIDGDGSRLS